METNCRLFNPAAIRFIVCLIDVHRSLYSSGVGHEGLADCICIVLVLALVPMRTMGPSGFEKAGAGIDKGLTAAGDGIKKGMEGAGKRH